MSERLIDRLEVPLHHRLAALAIGLLDALFNGLNRLVTRQHATDREEAGLHNRVDTPAHAGLTRDTVRVNDIEPQALLKNCPLDLDRQARPYLARAKGAIQQEDAAVIRLFEDIQPLQEGKLMAGDKVGLVDQIRRLDGVWAKAQMRGGHRAGLFRVIDEIALGVVI